MTKGGYGWPLVCPKCYDKPGQYYGILKVPHQRADLQCPNCKTRLVDAAKFKSSRDA